MNINKLLIEKYPFISKVDSRLECYRVKKYCYVVFYKELISKGQFQDIFVRINDYINKGHLTYKYGVVIIGFTNECFDINELIYSYRNGTSAYFYLIDMEKKNTYFRAEDVIPLSLSCKKIVMKIDNIVKSNFDCIDTKDYSSN